jgi:hypothetical protein
MSSQENEEKEILEQIACLKVAWIQVQSIRSECSMNGVLIFSDYDYKGMKTHYERTLNELRIKLSEFRGE